MIFERNLIFCFVRNLTLCFAANSGFLSREERPPSLMSDLDQSVRKEEYNLLRQNQSCDFCFYNILMLMAIWKNLGDSDPVGVGGASSFLLTPRLVVNIVITVITIIIIIVIIIPSQSLPVGWFCFKAMYEIFRQIFARPIDAMIGGSRKSQLVLSPITLLYPVSLWYLGVETDDHHRKPNINDRGHLVGAIK